METGDAEPARAWWASRPEPDPGDKDFAQGAATDLQERAMVALALGDLERAVADGRRSIQSDPKGINVHTAISVAGRAALWLRDLHSARSALDTGRHLHGRWIDAVLTSLRSGIAALEGRAAEAAAGFAEVRSAFRTLGCDLDAALTTLDEVILLGSVPDDELAVARRTFSAIQARPYLDRLDATAGDPAASSANA